MKNNFTFNISKSRAMDLPKLDWQAFDVKIKKLQYQIAVAYEMNDLRRVEELQRILTGSFAAQMLAMRTVFQSSGIFAAGVDNLSNPTIVQFWVLADQLGIIGKSPLTYLAKPVRRIWIPKSRLTNVKNRPLGIPTVLDRAVQALFLMTLEPCVEATSDANSYGFRKGLGNRDALTALWNFLHVGRFKPVLVYDADIKNFFPSVSHDWLLEHIPLSPHILKQFLKAGFVEDGTFNTTEEGFPQGGNISPAVANIVLNGLEKTIRSNVSKIKPSALDRVHVVRYADDFVVTAPQFRDVLSNIVAPAITRFLDPRGLQLNLEKTKVVDRKEGFSFLGFSWKYVPNNFRPGQWMWLVTPTDKAMDLIFKRIDDLFKLSLKEGWSIMQLITKLNQVLLGWANYYKMGHPAAAFSKVIEYVWRKYLMWCKLKYPKASMNWVFTNCFVSETQGKRKSPCAKPNSISKLKLTDIRTVKGEWFGKQTLFTGNVYKLKFTRTWRETRSGGKLNT